MLSMRLLLPNYKALDKNPPKMMSSVQKMVERIQSLHEAGLLAEHVAEEFISRGGGVQPLAHRTSIGYLITKVVTAVQAATSCKLQTSHVIQRIVIQWWSHILQFNPPSAQDEFANNPLDN
jgi:hypothetical protein